MKNLFLSLIFLILFTSPALAVDCFTDFVGNQEVSVGASCTLVQHLDFNDVDRRVSGIDAGTGATNSAILTVSAGTVTILSSETLVVGSLSLTGTGSATIAEGSVIKIGSPIWMIDQDSDGYPANDYFYFTSTPPTNGRRLNALTNISSQDCVDDDDQIQGGGTAYYEDSDGDGYGSSDESQSVCGSAPPGYVEDGTDCNDTGTNSENVYVSATCYLDSDDDNYGSTTSYSCTNNATCASATWASNGNGTAAASGTFADNNTDCYDSNANAFPGQTTCYSSNRGDGSFDYDCDSASSGCITCPASCPKGAWVWTKGCTTYCLNASNKQVTSNSGSAACGATGSKSYDSKKTSCSCCPCNLGTPKNIGCTSCTMTCK